MRRQIAAMMKKIARTRIGEATGLNVNRRDVPRSSLTMPAAHPSFFEWRDSTVISRVGSLADSPTPSSQSAPMITITH